MKISSKLVTNSLIILLNVFISMAVSSCGTHAIEVWTGKLYPYVANDLAFERKQDNEKISFDAPELKTTKRMICMVESDFTSFLNTYVNPKPKPK